MKKLELGALKADGTAYSAEEIKAHNDFIALVESTSKELTADLINKEDAKTQITDAIEKATGELKAIIEKQKETLIKQGTTIQGLKVQGNENKGKATLREALMKAFEDIKADIDEVIKNDGKQSKPLAIEVKVATTMSVTNTIGAGATQISITEDTGIISPIRKRAEKYLANVSVGTTTGNRAMWIEETDEQGIPIFIGEGVGKTQLSVKYVEKTANVKKIGVYGKVTTEMLADLPQLISYIENNLIKRAGLVIEDQLLNGNNVGDNLNGVIGVATAFDPGAAANTIFMANEFDVLNAVATQVEIANGVANAVFIHPRTVQKMKAIKATDGTPLYKEYTDILGDMTVSGMKIVSTTAIAEGNFLGGDMKAVNVLVREELGVQIGLDGNDFTNNLKTILVESRIVQFVSANDVPVIIKGDFATAIGALTATP